MFRLFGGAQIKQVFDVGEPFLQLDKFFVGQNGKFFSAIFGQDFRV